uniref:V-SNARE coiled-coil homology domain-containing protein n=1 Tax=Acanthochromis polyacanthus TaxID=80966 RepID=A0A3Q1G3Y2_9TELE
TGVSGENPHMHRENIQTQRIKIPGPTDTNMDQYISSAQRVSLVVCLVFFSAQARNLDRTTKKVENSYRWKNIKLIIFIVVIVLIIVLIIVLLATGVIPVSAPMSPVVTPTIKP